MFIRIQTDSELAIYDQVVRQIKYAIAAGAIRPDELVPSVRELARDLAINPNTVARAYRQLQSEKILVTVRGTGLAVTSQAVAKCKKERIALLQKRVRDVIEEARLSKIAPEELASIVEQELARMAVKGTQA